MNRGIVICCVAALVAVSVGLFIGMRDAASGGHHEGSTGLIALLPVYTALIPIYIATTRRRRKGCKKNG